MTRGPEATIEDRVVAQAKKHGWQVKKLTFIGSRGCPDRLFGRAGRCLLIEFKRYGENPTEQQRKRQEDLRTHFGFEVHNVDSYAWGCSVLGIPK